MKFKLAHSGLPFFLAIIVSSLPCPAIDLARGWESGEWFSTVQKLPNGFDAKELYLYENSGSGKFVMTRISFNNLRNWEETRYSGKWKILPSGKIILNPVFCSVYGAQEIGKRWVLIRGFDCDHLEFEVSQKSPDSVTMIPAMNLEGSEEFKKPVTEKNSVASVVLLSIGNEFISWGINLNRIRKGSSPYMLKKNGTKEKIEIVETVDSSGKYKSLSGKADPGDFIIIQNKARSGSLED
ncbi:MAG: hypothetical protein K8R21_05330 [Leptospira sp.]|nr:hypothetical protein [Leptospira sp.]